MADPRFALAYAGLADTFTLLAIHGQHPPKAVFPKAIKAANARPGARPESWRRTRIERRSPRRPTSGTGRAPSSIFGRPSRSIPATRTRSTGTRSTAFPHWAASTKRSNIIERSVALDPLSVSINTSLGGLLHDRREYSRAIDQYTSTIDLEPTFYFSYWNLGRTYEQLEQYDKALDVFQKAISLAPGSPHVLAYIGRYHAFMGHELEARRILNELLELRTRRFVHATGPAIVCLSLGDYDRAFDFFETAYGIARSG